MLKRCFSDPHIMVTIPASLERGLVLTARADLCAYMTTVVFYVDEPPRYWLNCVYAYHPVELERQTSSFGTKVLSDNMTSAMFGGWMAPVTMWKKSTASGIWIWLMLGFPPRVWAKHPFEKAWAGKCRL